MVQVLRNQALYGSKYRHIAFNVKAPDANHSAETCTIKETRPALALVLLFNSQRLSVGDTG